MDRGRDLIECGGCLLQARRLLLGSLAEFVGGLRDLVGSRVQGLRVGKDAAEQTVERVERAVEITAKPLIGWWQSDIDAERQIALGEPAETGPDRVHYDGSRLGRGGLLDLSAQTLILRCSPGGCMRLLPLELFGAFGVVAENFQRPGHLADFIVALRCRDRRFQVATCYAPHRARDRTDRFGKVAAEHERKHQTRERCHSGDDGQPVFGCGRHSLAIRHGGLVLGIEHVLCFVDPFGHRRHFGLDRLCEPSCGRRIALPGRSLQLIGAGAHAGEIGGNGGVNLLAADVLRLALARKSVLPALRPTSSASR